MKSSLSKLARWLIFTVIFALVPLGVATLALLTYSKPFSLSAIAEHGELLLIATVIGGSAVGELIAPRTHRWPVRKIVCGGATLVLVITSGMWFAIIVSSAGTRNSDVVSFGSLAILIFTILSSAGCVALSEL